ncbi:carboxypeptidase-like regulatory domain-containing protein [Hymenobacter sp. H14-R3]|uniref:carboxypeptidase-like regulatory domain-containing protein n=1 Tax=Hymenobacter sp. H14-R3 TaxID=3046308 RepID=UPI0024BA315D|nr:carboxypeptidase-like regulatory domain-containing protein [Hymenobacter sp. H14-R3]MDJ0366668.1 carboxypeptidase-like regulatory domain-containing protein [Hymenobacter sp. H14-R3]
MLLLRILFLQLLCALSAVAQVTVGGTVRDSLTRRPLPFASVFLANTTRGATTDAQGHYALAGVPAGHYELTATYLGYQLRQRAITVAEQTGVFDVALPPAAQQLAEVVVRPNPHRAADYQRFLELFLGTSTLAKQCRVRNPDAVQIDYDPERNVLMASASHALEVDNPALGYRLTFYDLDFQANFASQEMTVTSLSHLAFRELPGGAARQRRWAANRQRAYAGSLLHFLRSVHANQVAAAGFEVQRLRRVPNRRWARADSVRRLALATGQLRGQASLPDSVWQALQEPRVLNYLFAPLLPPAAYRRAAAGRVWLRFPNLLAITYLRAKPDANYHQLSLTLTPGREQASLLHLTQGIEAEIDTLGTPADPLALLNEGYWGFLQMGDLLPLDYQPPPIE